MHFSVLTILPYSGKRMNNNVVDFRVMPSDIPSKSELLRLVMFSYFTYMQCVFILPGQILCINTHPPKKYVK